MIWLEAILLIMLPFVCNIGQELATFLQMHVDLRFHIIQCTNYIRIFVQVKVNNTFYES